MDIAVIEIVDAKFTTTRSQIPFFVEVTSKFSNALSTKDLSDTEYAKIKFSFFYKKWICQIFLDHKLSFIVVLSGGALDKFSDLINIIEDMNTLASIGIFAWLHNPDFIPFVPLSFHICLCEALIALVLRYRTLTHIDINTVSKRHHFEVGLNTSFWRLLFFI